MRVELSALALEDVSEITLFIAEDSPVRAISFADDLYHKAQSLGLAPYKGVVREELGKGLRLLIHGAYGIYYRIYGEGLVIVRILHSARDLSPDDFA